MLAAALIVVMPVLSRTLPMGAMPGMGADCAAHHTAGAKHPDAPQAPADPTERCGYCVLLNHTPPLASGAAVNVVPSAPFAALAAFLPLGDKPALPRLNPVSRGPPAAI